MLAYGHRAVRITVNSKGYTQGLINYFLYLLTFTLNCVNIYDTIGDK